MSIAELRDAARRADLLAHHVTEEIPDLPESLIGRVIDLQLRLGDMYRRADEAAYEQRQARLDEIRREIADDRDELRAWRDEA